MRLTTRGHRQAFLALLAAPLLALPAACGSNAPDVGGQPGPSAGATTTTAGPEDLVPSKPPTAKDGVVSLQGTVALGVEAGCLVLSNASGTYTLLGGKVTAAQVGSDVVVTGTVATDVASVCQQGTLFTVSEVLTR
jgi:hypothetical protein